MEIKPERLKKLELSGTKQRMTLRPDERVEAIFKVNKPDYVPAHVRVRSRIDAVMFTGEFRAGALQQIESDSNVVSVSLSKRLRFIE